MSISRAKGLSPIQSIGSLNTEAIRVSQKNKSLKENRNIYPNRIDGLERKEPRNKYRSNHVLVIRGRATLQITKQAEYGKLQVSPGEKENKRQITRKSERKVKNADS